MKRTHELRRCPRCGESKPAAGNFYLVKKPEGLRWSGYCVPCAKAHAIAYQKAHPDRKKQYDAATREHVMADPVKREHARELKRAAEQARRAEYMREWRQKPETRAKYLVDMRAARARYAARNPERHRIKNAIQNNSNRARKLGREDNFRRDDWILILERFEDRCAYCGADHVLLDIDHLVAIGKGGGNVVGNVVPACRICNAQKHMRTLEAFSKLRGGLDLERIRRLAAMPSE